jgi:hypothetical protein
MEENPPSEKPRSDALAQLFAASNELVEIVRAMRDEPAWTVPGHMHRLAARASTEIYSMCLACETLAPITHETERFDCPDCRGQGAFTVVVDGLRRHFIQCATCEGKGHLP